MFLPIGTHNSFQENLCVGGILENPLTFQFFGSCKPGCVWSSAGGGGSNGAATIPHPGKASSARVSSYLSV